MLEPDVEYQMQVFLNDAQSTDIKFDTLQELKNTSKVEIFENDELLSLSNEEIDDEGNLLFLPTSSKSNMIKMDQKAL
eukprot:CAMPEP_0168625622 /NCGR_PEP_ID=MMETSP0449_2-20121227/10131_1 /TAXON_ID=1082188 /ORGANISM="Strombidium rassoulzadegani, Strain ras09" /LENGTH=77 /DNA_ID=CAMNT_0008667431 /DNA_START=67 /DNA_END=300 /DNA_ORIENTATION=-